MATSDLRNQYWATRGLQTGFTMVTGAVETADAVREASHPEPHCTQGRRVPTLGSKEPLLPPGAAAERNPQQGTHLWGPHDARRHRRTREAQGSEITHSGSQIRSEPK